MGVAEHLAQIGREVVLATRSGTALALTGVTSARADLTKPDDVRAVTRGAVTVYLCASPPYNRWADEFGPMIEGFARGVEQTDARIVFADNLYSYGPTDKPMTELTPDRPTGVKGRVRRDAVRRLFEIDRNRQSRVVIGRASNLYGPRVVDSALGLRVFEAVTRGKAAPCIGDIDMPHSYTYIDDFVRALIVLGTRDETPAQVWHVPSGAAHTTREMITLIARACSQPAKFMVAGRWLVTLLAFFNPTMRELKEVLYQFERPFVLESTKFETKFGNLSTRPEEAITRTLAWVRDRLPAMPVT